MKTNLKKKKKGNAAERQRSKYVNEYFPESQSLISTYLRIGLSQLNAISYMPSKTMGRCPMCSLVLWKRAEDLKPSGLPSPTPLGVQPLAKSLAESTNAKGYTCMPSDRTTPPLRITSPKMLSKRNKMHV